MSTSFYSVDEQANQLFILLREITQCCQEREAMQAKLHGLTTVEARTLVTMKLHHCRTTADLAEELFVAKSRVTRIMDRMVKRGFVTRSEDAEDRRRCLVHLTPKGIETTERLLSFILSLHREVLKAIPESSRAETLAMLGVLKEAMNSVRTRLREGTLLPIDSSLEGGTKKTGI